MPRKISENAARAFRNGDKFTQSNTAVVIFNDIVELRLFGNLIARREIDSGMVEFSMAGWGSVTTRDRLNALADAYYSPNGFYQKNYDQFYGEYEINPSEWYQL